MTSEASSSSKPHLYFMGICGTAMGSVAAAFRDLGYPVSGSDANVYDPMKTFLSDRGITILNGYVAENLSDEVDLYIVGNAQSRGNPEVEALLNEKARMVSLPELLKEEILRGRSNYVVAGTHGKTTTSSMLTWIFQHTGENPDYVIGGIPANFEQGARFTENAEITVLEGDEYDSAFFDKRSKFIHYLPEVAIVNNIEFDHADIFDDLRAVKRTFGHMMRLVPENGLIILNGDDPNCLEVYEEEGHAPASRVGLGENCDLQIQDIEYGEEGSTFRLGEEQYFLSMHGEFNVRNAAVAITAARFREIDPEPIREALRDFRGVKRRQDVRGVTGRGITVIDDFAHHPTAIREALTGLRHKYPGRRLWAIFEPRSNTTRRNVFQNSLPEALSLADAVCVSQIARLESLDPEDRLDPEKVMATIRENGTPAHYQPNAESIVNLLAEEAKDDDVVVVLSNGGFDGIHERLLEVL